MPVFKDEARGTWYVMVRYQDWTGERKQKCKRGFATKREAQEWERSFQMQTSGDLDMTFEAFTELYTKDMKPRLKENTWLTKENIIQKKILPYFGKRKISEITTKDVIAWQNELLAYRDEQRKPYSPTSRPCTTSSAPFSTTLSASMSFVPTPPPKLGTWERRSERKCCSGQRRSISGLRRP